MTPNDIGGDGPFVSSSESETESAGQRLGELLAPGDVVSLTGPLGCGKTVFVRGIARALGVGEPVVSPSFVIVQEYAGRLPLFHMDLYRLSSPLELEDVGLRDYLSAGGVCAIEWGEKAASVLPQNRIQVVFRWIDGASREITIERTLA